MNYRVVPPAVLLHGLAQTCEALANVAKLPLVMVLALGGLVRGHLGQVLHGAVKLGAELTEDLHLSVTETKNRSYFTRLGTIGVSLHRLNLHKIIVQSLVWDPYGLVEGAPYQGVLLCPPLPCLPSFLVCADKKM